MAAVRWMGSLSMYSEAGVAAGLGPQRLVPLSGSDVRAVLRLRVFVLVLLAHGPERHG